MTIDAVALMGRDLRKAAKTLSDAEARFLVDAYYQMQENRIRADAQVRSMADEPHGVLAWLGDQNGVIERQIKTSLDVYSANHPVGEWARSIRGVGPVIAAGLLAHIDINKAPTVGHIWSYAGLDPTKEWGKGQKRPWNASLKVVCWKMGESFVKTSGHEEGYYGHVYVERKKLETQRNEAMEFKGQAESILSKKKFREDTTARAFYTKGMLPPAHIHARAKRYAVKLFLAHLHDVWYRHQFDAPPPMPYAIAHLGHAHYIAPPNTN